MANDKPAAREFWLDIATPYGDPCDFIHNEDPKERAKRNNTHPCISATNIHVIEYSAYQAERERANKAEEENIRLKYESEAANSLGHERIVKAEKRAERLQEELTAYRVHIEFYREQADKLAEALEKGADFIQFAPGQGLENAFLPDPRAAKLQDAIVEVMRVQRKALADYNKAKGGEE